jgi:hypothetical protein
MKLFAAALLTIYFMVGKVSGKTSDGKETQGNGPISRNLDGVPNKGGRSYQSYLSRDIEFSRVNMQDLKAAKNNVDIKK